MDGVTGKFPSFIIYVSFGPSPTPRFVIIYFCFGPCPLPPYIIMVFISICNIKVSCQTTSPSPNILVWKTKQCHSTFSFLSHRRLFLGTKKIWNSFLKGPISSSLKQQMQKIDMDKKTVRYWGNPAFYYLNYTMGRFACISIINIYHILTLY